MYFFTCIAQIFGNLNKFQENRKSNYFSKNFKIEMLFSVELNVAIYMHVISLFRKNLDIL